MAGFLLMGTVQASHSDYAQAVSFGTATEAQEEIVPLLKRSPVVLNNPYLDEEPLFGA